MRDSRGTKTVSPQVGKKCDKKCDKKISINYLKITNNIKSVLKTGQNETNNQYQKQWKTWQKCDKGNLFNNRIITK